MTIARLIALAALVNFCFPSMSFSADDIVTIRTNNHQLAVSSSGRIGAYQPGARMSFFSDGADYLRDGSLILGTSRDNLSWALYEDSSATPTGTNPYGTLLPLTDITYDTTSSSVYRHAFGLGTNHDSSLGFTVDYYAPKANASYYIARFAIYKGLNDPMGTLSNLTVAFAADWDIPSTNAPANYGNYSSLRQVVYTRGGLTLPEMNRIGGIAALRDDDTEIVGGMNLPAAVYVDPLGTYQVDSLWNRMDLLDGYDTTGTIEDLTDIVVAARDVVIDGSANDTFFVSFVIVGLSSSPAVGLESTVVSAFYFICRHIAPTCEACICGGCGDSNSSGGLSISDAVYTVNYIFLGGNPPAKLCLGDINGDIVVNISDVVYTIAHIFGGGPPPICIH